LTEFRSVLFACFSYFILYFKAKPLSVIGETSRKKQAGHFEWDMELGSSAQRIAAQSKPIKGVTPFELVNGRPYKGPVALFGEPVFPMSRPTSRTTQMVQGHLPGQD
jgi:hypothetical protein